MDFESENQFPGLVNHFEGIFPISSPGEWLEAVMLEVIYMTSRCLDPQRIPQSVHTLVMQMCEDGIPPHNAAEMIVKQLGYAIDVGVE